MILNYSLLKIKSILCVIHEKYNKCLPDLILSFSVSIIFNVLSMTLNRSKNFNTSGALYK